MNVIRITATDGTPVEFVDDVIGSGTMKDVYFSPCGNYVVAFYRDQLDAQAIERLEMITEKYRERIFTPEHKDYWENLFCWPEKVVEYKGRVGITAPKYHKRFFFEHGSINNDILKIKGKEKQGKWFASAKNQNMFLDPREKGTWINYLRISLMIARGVRRLHAAGLAHSDLSYKNVLVSPVEGSATIIDLDGLVVPGKFPPDVAGTPDFIAPEVVATAHLKRDAEGKVLPSIQTDRHALAVLIYHYLFLRHPLRGDKIHHTDPDEDEKLLMGEKALFIEHPTNTENRVNAERAHKSTMPWADTARLPYDIAGPYLKKLFERAFIEGLHEPAKRPTADEWEAGLIKTVDMLQPCQNTECAQKWYVYDGASEAECPYCGTGSSHPIPVFHFYTKRAEDNFVSEHQPLMIYNNQSIFPWHINRFVTPNERVKPHERSRVGYCVYHKEVWYLVNERMPALQNMADKTPFAIGSQIKLQNGMQLLVGDQNGDRLIKVEIVNAG